LLEACQSCGIPLMVGKGLNWDSNGTITLAGSPKNRMVFFESETIDGLFKGIEELIGMPIEHIIIESRARETKRYIERNFPPELRKPVAFKQMTGKEQDLAVTPEERREHLAAIRNIAQTIIDISRIYGYGDQRVSDLWKSGGDYPWRTQIIRNPYSLPFIAADNLGSVEVFEETDMWVRYEGVGESVYKIEVHPGKHPVGLKARLKRKRYNFKVGEITYERCPECGIPLEVAHYEWDLEGGTYIDPNTGRKTAIFGPSALDAVLDDLAAELGEAIPKVVIEAQRRYIRSEYGMEQWNRSGSTFQHMVAVRGLGNLVEFEGDKDTVSMKIENACLHLLMVGTIQALVELAYGVDSSNYEWNLADDGDLDVIIRVA
jgi:hypothetical protein